MVPSRPSALNYYFHAYVKIFVGGIRGRERESFRLCHPGPQLASEKLSNTSLHDVVSTIVETQAPLLYLCICILRKSAVQQSFVDLLTSLIFIRYHLLSGTFFVKISTVQILQKSPKRHWLTVSGQPERNRRVTNARKSSSFLASQDALEVMLFTYSLTNSWLALT